MGERNNTVLYICIFFRFFVSKCSLSVVCGHRCGRFRTRRFGIAQEKTLRIYSRIYIYTRIYASIQVWGYTYIRVYRHMYTQEKTHCVQVFLVVWGEEHCTRQKLHRPTPMIFWDDTYTHISAPCICTYLHRDARRYIYTYL